MLKHLGHSVNKLNQKVTQDKKNPNFCIYLPVSVRKEGEVELLIVSVENIVGAAQLLSCLQICTK